MNMSFILNDITSGMHAVVTGNTGFIGTELTTDLLKKGYKVTALSRNQEKTKSFTQNFDPNLHLINCDILKQDSLEEVFKKISPVDYVFHLAGQTYAKALSNPQIYFQNNFMGTLNMLECCRNFGVKKFVLSSSIAVYGLSANQSSPQYLPVDEKHPLKPFDFYDVSKYHAEELCRFYLDRFDIKSIILRYSRVFGPKMEKGLISQAIKKALTNESIEVFGDISTDFVHVNDVVKANIASIKKEFSDLQVFNIGSGNELTLQWICSKITELCNSSSKIIMHPEPKSKFSLDVSKAKTFLEYEPTDIEEGLLECVNYIKNSKK